MWKPRTNLRALVAAAGFVGAVLLPSWVPIIAIAALALWWRAWEALMLGLLVDFLWLPLGHAPFFTIGAILIVWLLEPIRKEFLTW